MMQFSSWYLHQLESHYYLVIIILIQNLQTTDTKH